MTAYITATNKYRSYYDQGEFLLYIRFSDKLDQNLLAREMGRKSLSNFGCDRNNTLSCFSKYKKCKNFMLTLKRELKKLFGNDIKEIRIKKL